MGKLRARLLTRPIFAWAKTALPHLSDTEREAIEAGDVWWDGDLFTGDPDWKKLLAFPPAKLSEEEQRFLDGPVDALCAMLNDWQINWELHDLPQEAWDFLKANKFFAMIIPKTYGGLGFSATAHSEVIRKLSTRSVAAAVTAMVPNSLGPGELLIRFGTKEQQDYWLPRLADAREIPCFGLTSPEAGSDAAAMIDEGVVCKGQWQGKETLGVRLNWHKRYITLAPVATVLGLAFKLHDPDHLIGTKDDIGITLGLVPTNLAGVEIGRRHLPAMNVFQNGPTFGRDVFIPMDHIIGGVARVGQGWRMLMSALAAGRGISLPSQSAAGAALSAYTAGAYARIRVQFGVAIGEFEAIQERLARIAGIAYLLDAARRMTTAALDAGHHPAVVSAIMKEQATERMRVAANDAMDIHGGKGVIEGPHNYLGSLYRSIPVGITVEGANILTKALIQFGQGAIRSHPYLLSEITALGETDADKGLADFDTAFWHHANHALGTAFRSFARSWFGSGRAPYAGRTAHYYRRLSRYAAAFAITADLALLTLGGALKRREMLSARFGGLLSELYLLSAALKRWEDEGRQDTDLPILAYVMDIGFAEFETTLDAILRNLPSRFAAAILRAVTLPFGIRAHGPSDDCVREIAALILNPTETRARLTFGIAHGIGDDGLARLEKAFRHVTTTDPIRAKLRAAHEHDWRKALETGVISAIEAQAMKLADDAVALAIAVDDFAPAELTRAARETDVKVGAVQR